MAPAPGEPGDPGSPAGADDAVPLVRLLAERGWTVAIAESLTGGLVTAALVDVPGASRVLRGGVVAYATALKHDLLGVDTGLLDLWGPVHPDVAAAMARGVRDRLRADVGLATTGVAGPGPQDGHPPGEVHVAVVAPEGAQVRSVRLDGDRSAVRVAARREVLALAVQVVGGMPPGGNTHPVHRVG